MRGMKKRWALCLLLGSSVLAQNTMLHYCNPRFAFCIDYPRDFRMQPAPDNGDGSAGDRKIHSACRRSAQRPLGDHRIA